MKNLSLQQSKKPGSESMMFDDPESVLRTAVSQRTPCQRCGAEFIPETNTASSCSFHADVDGLPGFFRLGKGGGWTCCGANWEGAKGCNSRPHVGKEHVVMARIDSLPKLICGETELSIYKHIEFTFYPGTKYTLNIQVTKAISKLFMTYFLGEGLDKQKGGIGGSDVADTLKHGLEDAVENARQKVRSESTVTSKASLRERSCSCYTDALPQYAPPHDRSHPIS